MLAQCVLNILAFDILESHLFYLNVNPGAAHCCGDWPCCFTLRNMRFKSFFVWIFLPTFPSSSPKTWFDRQVKIIQCLSVWFWQMFLSSLLLSWSSSDPSGVFHRIKQEWDMDGKDFTDAQVVECKDIRKILAMFL